MTRIPLSTYRLQFNRNFTFAQAAEIVPYLAELGISHCYASPYLRARPGSMHGYDIIDHHHLNPEIGSPEDYERWVAALHEHGMGQILDVVPNHMGVMGSDNAWWLDVLENGEASSYAEFFDIDWEPLKDELQGKVLVAVLGDQYGTVLDRGELKLVFDAEKGEFSIWYFQHRFPVNPREYPRVLSVAAELMQTRPQGADEHLPELQSLISAFGHLPGRNETSPEKRAERSRDKEIHKRRLAELCARSHRVMACVEQSVSRMNGVAGDSASFDQLHELIKAQAFRLAYWRVAADDINYRRFFDVNDLAALRQENEEVFRQTHEFVLQLLREGKIDGLRIDHPDGLYNPRQYFQRLQCGADAAADCSAKTHYVVAEKILTGQEQLTPDWPIHGTTGYDFSNLVNGLFVDAGAERSLTQAYWSFMGDRPDFPELVYECKKLVMDRSLNSELNVLANHLSRIALADRHTCDFTVKSLRDALGEIVACFPVYRTYVSEHQVSEVDRRYIVDAVECAKERASAADSSVYDFIRDVLLTSQAESHPEYYRNSVIHFAMRFQQYSSAVMAKGLEDTSFYRYHRLVSLNDVGGNPSGFGASPERFHAAMRARAAQWPEAMLATSTHDSKRSEDVRARINVLSEVPDLWAGCVARWRELNRRHKRGDDIPTANDEYLLYQTLAGAWPLGGEAESLPGGFVQRINEYMLKAVREAKDKSSWANQNQEYESGLTDFVKAVLESEEFRNAFTPLQNVISHFGMLNSLAQTVIKLTAPGVPDIYQGNELWEFSLVDPDNRRAVDYSERKRVFDQLRSASEKNECTCRLARELTDSMRDGRIKEYVTWKTLALRKANPDPFSRGQYSALETVGMHATHVLAFARKFGDSQVVVIVPRLCTRLLGPEIRLPLGESVWRDTKIRVPAHRPLSNIFTREQVATREIEDAAEVDVSSALANFPVAVLTS
ncbi:MAG TPA: malto-oligosyltrehalose synthase [Terriglobales bacterium]